MGFGLSIDQRICDMLAMQLTLDSHIDVGSTFKVCIERGDYKQLAHQTTVEEVPSFIQELCVPIVDNEEQVRVTMQQAEVLLLTNVPTKLQCQSLREQKRYETLKFHRRLQSLSWA